MSVAFPVNAFGMPASTNDSLSARSTQEGCVCVCVCSWWKAMMMMPSPTAVWSADSLVLGSRLRAVLRFATQGIGAKISPSVCVNLACSPNKFVPATSSGLSIDSTGLSGHDSSKIGHPNKQRRNQVCRFVLSSAWISGCFAVSTCWKGRSPHLVFVRLRTGTAGLLELCAGLCVQIVH